MAASNKKQVTLDVAGEELKFEVGIKEFTDYQNQFMPNNKVAPSENFLTFCSVGEQKDQLIDLFDRGYGVELAQIVAAEFKPEITIEVKK